jgi:glycosyltransferase involved in cell wall biosynthesis
LYALNKAVQRQLAEAADFDLIYERHSLFSYAAMEYARHKCIPGILEVNAPLVDEQAQYRVLVNRELAERTVRRVMTAAGGVIAVSREVAEHVRFQRLSHSNIYVIPNGVDLTRFDAEFSGRLTCGDFTIGFVGTLKPWHGVETLIRALPAVLERVPSAVLLIVGDGPARTELERLAVEVLGEASCQIQFRGAVSADQIPALLGQMDVAVAPYHYRDGFYFSPLKVFEYMAAALPIVASDVGQLAEILVDGESGLLVRPNDPEQLASALTNLARDPALCETIGSNAREVVERSFTWRSVVNDILSIAATVDIRSGSSAEVSLQSVNINQRIG